MVSTLSIVSGNGTKEVKMNKLSTIFFASFALAACTGTPHPAISAEDPNILILCEDSDPDSVPRNNRIFKRVLNAVSNQLGDEGFNVYDETAVTLDDFVQGRYRRLSSNHFLRRSATPAAKSTAVGGDVAAPQARVPSSTDAELLRRHLGALDASLDLLERDVAGIVG